jgi:hypothetical protein
VRTKTEHARGEDWRTSLLVPKGEDFRRGAAGVEYPSTFRARHCTQEIKLCRGRSVLSGDLLEGLVQPRLSRVVKASPPTAVPNLIPSHLSPSFTNSTWHHDAVRLAMAMGSTVVDPIVPWSRPVCTLFSFPRNPDPVCDPACLESSLFLSCLRPLASPTPALHNQTSIDFDVWIVLPDLRNNPCTDQHHNRRSNRLNPGSSSTSVSSPQALLVGIWLFHRSRCMRMRIDSARCQTTNVILVVELALRFLRILVVTPGLRHPLTRLFDA